MSIAIRNYDDDIRDEFMNITLLLLSLGLWCLILAGDLLPGKLPDIVLLTPSA